MVRLDEQCGAERAQLEQKDEQLQQKDEQVQLKDEQLRQQGDQLREARLVMLEMQQKQLATAASPNDRTERKLVRVQQRPRPRPALLEQQRPAAVAAPPAPPPWRDARAVLVDDATGKDARDCGVAPAPP